ncbi:hypothetical protein ABZ656_09215 [Streptomyces sp. NPDC007095]|uniref:hypothetical protein n=1 Tax=Streptomyces sp. NPDC007095 TaxID=3154482 RepID=UPI000CA90E92
MCTSGPSPLVVTGGTGYIPAGQRSANRHRPHRAQTREQGSSDLGIPYFREHDGSWGYVFGDSWTGMQQSGDCIGSPVMLNQASFDASGATPISFTRAQPTGGQAGQLPRARGPGTRPWSRAGRGPGSGRRHMGAAARDWGHVNDDGSSIALCLDRVFAVGQC